MRKARWEWISKNIKHIAYTSVNPENSWILMSLSVCQTKDRALIDLETDNQRLKAELQRLQEDLAVQEEELAYQQRELQQLQQHSQQQDILHHQQGYSQKGE